MVDPDLELRGLGGSLDLLALSAIFLSVISSFVTQNKGGGGGVRAPRAPPLDPPLVYYLHPKHSFHVTQPGLGNV